MSCLSDIEGQSDGDKPLVLHQFTRNVQIEDVKTGKMVDVSTSGIVFSTKRLLLYYKSLVTSLKDKPRYFVPTVFADGTYRLVKGTTRSGAVLCDMGLHTIKWEKNMDVERAHYLPLMYMYVQTECYEAYRDFFSTFKHAPVKLLGLDAPFVAKYGSLDRAAYIAKAYHEVWPEP